MVGFSHQAHRTAFINNSEPGALFCVFVPHGKAIYPQEAGRLIGIFEVSHEIGDAKEFIRPEDYLGKQADIFDRDRWNYAVKATRAWAISGPDLPLVEDVARETFDVKHGAILGGPGKRLTPADATRIADLPVTEVPVYGGLEYYDPDDPAPLADKILRSRKPSRAVPRSLEPFLVDEGEGPRCLYMLELNGDMCAFLGMSESDLAGRRVIKVGYSKDPRTRLRCFNNAMPACAFSWILLRMSDPSYSAATSDEAARREQLMKDALKRSSAECLGGEFYLADTDQIENAWRTGLAR